MAASFYDNFNLITKLNLSKSFNALLVYSSFYWAKISKNGVVNGLPLSITIEPTTACNLGCPECPSGLKQFTRAEGNLKTDFYKKIIDEVKQHAFYLNFYFQGEPYINPNFLEMVSYANAKKIYTATSTNAHFLTPQKAEETVKSGLSRLTISIDGTTQETYESYRKGGDLNKVLEGAKNIIEAKKKLNSKTPYVIFQFLVVQPNEHQIEDAKKLSTQMGVDEIRFKTAQVYDYKNGNPLIPTIEKYARYKKQTDGTYRLKNKLLNECWRMWSSCVITWDGKIVPCCFDKDAKHQLGDLKENTLKQIWLNKKYLDFRKTLLNNRAEIDICQNCTEGTKVFD
ncbi:MAG: SPASM domain-containing protein [Flavobacteriales bacterium]|nr:SPASM domain-containing protein [Flavobacteriales bacterium]MCB9175304.1 SPASM domain-containing protein [Flavobacteriales bacterium]